jgi:hypothetical protein
MIVGVLYPPHREVLNEKRGTVGDRVGEQLSMALAGVGLEAEQRDALPRRPADELLDLGLSPREYTAVRGAEEGATSPRERPNSPGDTEGRA